MLTLERAHAQVVSDCINEVASGSTVSPLTAHVGDTITVQLVNAGTSGGDCDLRDVFSWLVLPNNNPLGIFTNGVIPSGSCFRCPVSAACLGSGTCLSAGSITYVVNVADIGRNLEFPTAGNTRLGSHFTLPGIPNYIQFMPAAEGVVPPGGNASGLTAAARGQSKVLIVHPHITVTKECVNPCTPIGSPIQFRGTVCNDGDVTLTGVTVTDNPAATIVFSTTTSSGNAFPAAGGGTLRAGECVNFTGSYQPTGNACGPFTDTVTASGSDAGTPGLTTNAQTVTASASATCHVQTNPRITLTKDCQPRNITAGQSYTETFVVCNTGDVTLNNVVIHDSKVGDIAIGTLAPGQCATNNQGPFTTTVADCPSVTDRATASGDNACPADAICPAPRTVISSEVTCTVNIACGCEFTIQKFVACFLGNGNCGTFAKTATGVKDDACPSFCYRFTITNTGQVPLVLTSLIDDNGTPANTADDINLTSQFNAPGPLPVGQSRTINIGPIEHCVDTRNIVTGVCTGPDQVTHTHRDTNLVTVLQINLECVTLLLHSALDLDGNTTGVDTNGLPVGADDNHVTLPSDSQNVPISLTLTLRNSGTADLTVDQLNGLPTLTDCDTGAPIDPTTLVPFSLPAGASRTISLGCASVSCPGTSFSITAHGVADDHNGTLCVFNKNGTKVGDTSGACVASVNCNVATTCRVTGGGVLLPGNTDQSCISVPTIIVPFTVNGLTVNKITHGGQLGAPFAHMDCGAILGNPCIRGQWSHTRHYEGKGNPRDVIDMDFHSQTPKGQYDSLSCACLGCCDPSTGAFISPTLGPLIHKFQICNPDDHKVCGPQPRPAPANVIIWSGVGRITPETDSGSNGRNAEWVIFRIYIEDRSEPGGNHAGGAVEPADIYCFQAWKTGIKLTKKPDFSTVETALRRALGEANCQFLEDLKSGALKIGSLPSPTVAGRTADIQDCGPMYTGNHQIHPVTGANDNCVDPVQ